MPDTLAFLLWLATHVPLESLPQAGVCPVGGGGGGVDSVPPICN